MMSQSKNSIGDNELKGERINEELIIKNQLYSGFRHFHSEKAFYEKEKYLGGNTFFPFLNNFEK